MFGNQRNLNEFWKAFDEMFSQFENAGEWKTQTKMSEDGTYKITSYFYTNGNDSRPQKSGLQSLKSQLETAIENEDFEKAVELRDKIKNLETNQKEIQKLEMELKKSIEEQNFEKSIEIRDQLRKLK